MRNFKHQAALSVAHGAILRASEVCRLKVGDVDSQQMALRVEQGKGAKDRYAMLSPVVLQRLTASTNRELSWLNCLSLEPAHAPNNSFRDR